MKVLVAVKPTAVLDDEFELLADGSGVDEDSIDWEMNEWDRFAVEAGLLAREAAGDGEVVAVTVCADESESVLLNALAMGADRGVRVWDDALEGERDPLVVASLIAAVIERETPDLVFAGVQSSDAMHGATGVAAAAFAGLRHVAVVRSAELVASGAAIEVERELEGGLAERLRVELPALLTVQTGANEPRYATFRAIKQADAKPRDVLDLAALGRSADDLDGVRGARVQRFVTPTLSERAEMLEGAPDEVARRIAAIVGEALAR